MVDEGAGSEPLQLTLQAAAQIRGSEAGHEVPAQPVSSKLPGPLVPQMAVWT